MTTLKGERMRRAFLDRKWNKYNIGTEYKDYAKD